MRAGVWCRGTNAAREGRSMNDTQWARSALLAALLAAGPALAVTACGGDAVTPRVVTVPSTWANDGWVTGHPSGSGAPGDGSRLLIPGGGGSSGDTGSGPGAGTGQRAGTAPGTGATGSGFTGTGAATGMGAGGTGPATGTGGAAGGAGGR